MSCVSVCQAKAIKKKVMDGRVSQAVDLGKAEAERTKQMKESGRDKVQPMIEPISGQGQGQGTLSNVPYPILGHVSHVSHVSHGARFH